MGSRKGSANRVKSKARIENCQAVRIIDRLGGAKELSRLLAKAGIKINPSAIYRWTYPAPKGTNGVIPARWLKYIIQAARLDGTLFTSEELDPRVGGKKNRFNEIQLRKKNRVLAPDVGTPSFNMPYDKVIETEFVETPQESKYDKFGRFIGEKDEN